MLDKKTDDEFPFSKNDVVLAKYEREVFYAKVMNINFRKKFAKLLFDDGSSENISFKDIFDVNETTSDIICVVCKKDSTEVDNDIVLCDQCNIGFHQICHEPEIPSDVLKPDIPWECCYCSNKLKNPHVESNPFEQKMEIEEPDEAMETRKCQEELEKLRVNEDNVVDSTVEIKNEYSEIITTKNENEITSTSDHEKLNENDFMYGEQVVIAHADSTSSEKNEEELIVDVESDDDCHVFVHETHIQQPQSQADSSKQMTNDRNVNLNEKRHEDERFSKDLPKHNWLVDRLKMENKLQDKEIKEIEKSVYSSQDQSQEQSEHSYLKRYLEERNSKVRNVQNVLHVDTQCKTIYDQNPQKSKGNLKFESRDYHHVDLNNNSLRIPVTDAHQALHRRSSLPAQHYHNIPSPVLDTRTKLSSSVHKPRHSGDNHSNQQVSCFRRQLSDITLSSSKSPSFYSPTKEHPIFVQRQRLSSIDTTTKHIYNDYKHNYRPSSAPCKTKIYRPEDIEKCLKNIFPSEKHVESPSNLKQHTKANHSFIPSIRINNNSLNDTLLDKNETQIFRYQPYAQPHTKKRYRMHSDSTVCYLNSEDAANYRSIQRPISEPREIYEYKRSSSVTSSIPSIPSPGYDTSNVFQAKDLGSNRYDLLSPRQHRCLSCGRVAQLLCCGCQNVRYCSRECQLDDWRDHQFLCSMDKLKSR